VPPLPKILSGLLLVLFSLLHAEAIDEYNTTITVRPDGSLHIREAIRYDFGNLQRHGIYRDIPLTVKLGRYAPEVSIGLSAFRVTLDGASVPWKQERLRSRSAGSMVRYRIGDPEHTLTGTHTYTLEYDIARGVFPSDLPGKEAIRWNAVGAGSSVMTRRADAEILLPPELAHTPLTIRSYTGSYGSRGNRADQYRPDARRIRFHADYLGPYEALTVEVNYPVGMLRQSAERLRGTLWEYLWYYWYLWAGALYLFWLYRYTRRLGIARFDPGSVAPRYRPPEGMSVLQAGLLMDRFADAEDLTAAVLELGVLGCLEIDPSGDPHAPVIRRRDPGCDPERLTEDQRILMEEILFRGGDSYTVRSGDAERAAEIKMQMKRLGERLYDWSVRAGLMRRHPAELRQRFLKRAGSGAALLSALALWDLSLRYGSDLIFPLAISALFALFGADRLREGLRTRSYAWIFFGGI
jgi:hypothetical protein